MTTLLREAFSRAGELPDAEQDAPAARIIPELAEEDDLDRCVAATVHELGWLIDEARRAPCRSYLRVAALWGMRLPVLLCKLQPR